MFRIASSLALLLTLALIACNGFFTNAILQSINVGPASPTIAVGSTQNAQQMTATGINDDSSTSTLSNVTWTSSASSVAGISANGMLTAGALPSGTSMGTTVITATSGSISGTTTATVLSAALQSINITGGAQTITPGSGSLTFTATGNLVGNQPVTLTNVTWSSSDRTNVPITSGGVATAAMTAPMETVTITATVTTPTGPISATFALQVL